MDSLRRLLDATSRCLCRYENLVGGRPVLAAISGGIDSTVLGFVLERLRTDNRLPGPLVFCHVDHGVRADSAKNADYVRDFAERLDVPLHVRRLEPPGKRPSEDWLRQARYDAIGQVAKSIGAGVVVTAHHADDNLETVLFRLLRGTGPRGLAGIPESRWLCDGGARSLLVRPFLRVRRTTLATLLARIGQSAYRDTTNQDLGYARNRLRLETIPRLQRELGVGLDVALMTVSSTARAATEILDAQGQRVLAERATLRSGWCLELDLRGLSADDKPFVQEALRMAHGQLHPRGEFPLRIWLDRAMTLLQKADGTRLAGRGGLLLERTRKGLMVLDPERAGSPPPAVDDGQLLLWDSGPQRFGATEWFVQAAEHPLPPMVPTPREAGPFRALLDPRSAPLPWRLRVRRPGDRFRPYGCDHDMELRRFLLGRHVPRFDRDRLPLLVDGQDRILWVPGGDIADFAKIQLNTHRTIEVRAFTR
ncbi:MAG: tRNA lysidine(34) synthetase TilS [Planctomycetota bacterium]